MIRINCFPDETRPDNHLEPGDVVALTYADDPPWIVVEVSGRRATLRPLDRVFRKNAEEDRDVSVEILDLFVLVRHDDMYKVRGLD